MSQVLHFYLNISYYQFQTVYRTPFANVRTRALDGRIIEFPAHHLKPFLTRQGIQGRFEMTLSTDNRLISLQKLT